MMERVTEFEPKRTTIMFGFDRSEEDFNTLLWAVLTQCMEKQNNIHVNFGETGNLFSASGYHAETLTQESITKKLNDMDLRRSILERLSKGIKK